MHEFSIVQSIVDIATATVTQNRLKKVSSVEVEVGQVTGIVPEAMEFAWESARKNTVLAQASLVIKIIPLQVKCLSCGQIHNPENLYDACPGCGAIDRVILTGRELRVTAIQT